MKFSHYQYIALLSVITVDTKAADSAGAVGTAASTSQIISLFLGLIVVLGIFFLVTYLLKRFTGIKGFDHGHMKIVDAMHLGAKEKLVIVKVLDQHILLGISSQGINKLQELEASSELQQQRSEGNFTTLLNNLKYKRA